MRNFLPEALRDVGAESLRAEWEHLARGVPGEVSVHLRGADGPVACLRADSPHYAASTIKLAIGVAVFSETVAGRADLDETLEVRSDFDSAAGGRFIIRQTDDQDDRTWGQLGEPVALGSLVERMILDSSNISTNLIVEAIGAEAVHRVLADARVSRTALRHLIGDERAMAVGILNSVTAGGLARLMSALAGGRLLPDDATDVVLDLLARTRSGNMIPAGLPGGTWSAGKAGWTPAVDHDVALVRPANAPEYVLAVCTTTGLGERAQRLIARVSAATHERWVSWHTS